MKVGRGEPKLVDGRKPDALFLLRSYSSVLPPFWEKDTFNTPHGRICKIFLVEGGKGRRRGRFRWGRYILSMGSMWRSSFRHSIPLISTGTSHMLMYNADQTTV